MSRQVASFFVVVICVAVVVGCWSRLPPRVRAPRINAAAAGEAAIEQYDTDGDGAISGEELEKAPSLKRASRQIDRNDDGKINAKEIADRIREWQASRLGRRVLTCTVNKDGKPLEGATITFVPEEFLGDQVQTATGVTDESGMAAISVPLSGNDPPGVAPGLYLVRITGEDIPAKYNTETILGEEVAQDSEALIAGGPTYELD